MAFQCTPSPLQAALPLVGGANGLPLTFVPTSNGRRFAAARGDYLYEILPVPFQTLWQARIRSRESGCEIACQLFGIKQLADAKSWLQDWAARRGGGQ
jgi:hypothetical protein